jgi:hypothetical protein
MPGALSPHPLRPGPPAPYASGSGTPPPIREFEFWFAALKVTAIMLFPVLSVLAIFGGRSPG